MNNFTRIISIAAISGISSIAIANTGEVIFNGVVSDTTCTLDVSQQGIAQADNTVTLDPITTAEFLASDTAYKATGFSLVATDAGSATCNLTGKGASVQWTGQLYVGHNILQNIATGGAANVGMQLLESDGTTPVTVNGSPSIIADASGASLDFNVGYAATDATAVTEGQVRSIANYSIVFN
ncbi:MAG: pilus assembly protein [Alcanivorax borkumensis]|jgi:major type 1 subunit fimbrin (pilin)|uniref:Type-1 fimbrial protein, A chain n=1 Tax=Alcanivorax borkumensis (strain ATCC 700651 / DSM 11573 / NCIMB 13689 / SK2) TaxID=393595 RepID=Q0VTG9_ALCBS|nr:MULTISPECIES: fimbrial protein [Alcanivorax]OJH07697.1 MAG: pilus assembly protein [Alcanivorax borkumensis]BAP12981.1 type I fimbrial protein A chain [Alcanivorax sp. NBRC 101098]CAL15574.1 Type-1 fimbrial protein, A chain precursor [Alcanivorax borkumensis SK2]